ncbi:MAG: DUF2065 domain-containing protein [Alphaproteobacteria bacterium]
MAEQGPMTEILARIFGLYMIAAGIGVLFSRSLFSRMLDELRGGVTLAYLSGVLAFAVGAVTVSLHNDWAGPPAAVISLIGWLALAEGTLLLAAPRPFLNALARVRLKGGVITGLGAFAVLLGGWLLAAGF